MKSYDIEHRLRGLITREARNFVQSGGNLTVLAKRAGVSRATVSRLVYGETMYPRFGTMVAVGAALGIGLTIAEQKHSPKPVTQPRAIVQTRALRLVK